MDVAPKDGITVVTPDVPAGDAHWLGRDSVGSLAEHPDVVAAFDVGAKSVLVVGPGFAEAQARETERVRSLMKEEAETHHGLYRSEPPSVDEFMALAEKMGKGNA